VRGAEWRVVYFGKLVLQSDKQEFSLSKFIKREKKR